MWTSPKGRSRINARSAASSRSVKTSVRRRKPWGSFASSATFCRRPQVPAPRRLFLVPSTNIRTRVHGLVQAAAGLVSQRRILELRLVRLPRHQRLHYTREELMREREDLSGGTDR